MENTVWLILYSISYTYQATAPQGDVYWGNKRFICKSPFGCQVRDIQDLTGAQCLRASVWDKKKNEYRGDEITVY